MTQSTEPPARKGKPPKFTAYHVRESEDAKAFWTRIGSAWPHDDGNGFTILADVVPLDGRIVVRPRAERKE
jgi:hypothetical protein